MRLFVSFLCSLLLVFHVNLCVPSPGMRSSTPAQKCCLRVSCWVGHEAPGRSALQANGSLTAPHLLWDECTFIIININHNFIIAADFCCSVKMDTLIRGYPVFSYKLNPQLPMSLVWRDFLETWSVGDVTLSPHPASGSSSLSLLFPLHVLCRCKLKRVPGWRNPSPPISVSVLPYPALFSGYVSYECCSFRLDHSCIQDPYSF